MQHICGLNEKLHQFEFSDSLFSSLLLFPYVFFAAGFLDIHIRSEGCNDPGKLPNTCGRAYIKVNGRDHSLHKRGHNVVVVDATTGNAATKGSFTVLAQFKGALPLLSVDKPQEMLPVRRRRFHGDI